MLFRPFTTAYVSFGDVSALKPEWWALEGLVVLEERLIAANVVNRDYDSYFVNAGDTVHVHKPGTFTANHKVVGSAVTPQLAAATGAEVKLNQHIEVTFNIDDRDLQASIKDLRGMFLVPAVRAIAEGMDSSIVGEVAGAAIRNSAGELGQTFGTSGDALINLGKLFDANNVPAEGRFLIVGPAGKANLLKVDRFTDVNKSGLPISPTLTGVIGDVMGFTVLMSQTVGSTLATVTSQYTEDRTSHVAAAAGATSMTVSAGTAITEGQFFTIESTDGIYCADAAVDATGTALTFYPGLWEAVAVSKNIRVCDVVGDVKGDHKAGSVKIITDQYAAASDIPAVGQGLMLGTTISSAAPPVCYTVKSVSGTWSSSASEITLELNRPLDAAVADKADINLMPTNGGSYNLALTQNAITLVNRPLAPASTGVAATVQNNGQVALRVTIGYDQDTMYHKITVDTLYGVKTLDYDQVAALLC